MRRQWACAWVQPNAVASVSLAQQFLACRTAPAMLRGGAGGWVCGAWRGACAHADGDKGVEERWDALEDLADPVKVREVHQSQHILAVHLLLEAVEKPQDALHLLRVDVLEDNLGLGGFLHAACEEAVEVGRHGRQHHAMAVKGPLVGQHERHVRERGIVELQAELRRDVELQ